jgi:hypothetical protein
LPLPTGTWITSIGGKRQSLEISSVDASGQVVGGVRLLPTALITLNGVWDEDGQKLTLVGPLVPVAPGDLRAPFIATAYLFSDPINLTGVIGSVIFTLCGQIEYFAQNDPDPLGLSPSARRSAFGWYAQIGID